MFCLKKRVYYHDTDSGGVVYYGSYLKHLEEARAEYFLSKGISTFEYSARGIVFPVVHLDIDYKSPAKYGDQIEIYTRTSKIGNASVHFAHEIKIGPRTLLLANIIWACVDKNLKPQRVPEEIRAAFKDDLVTPQA